MLVMRWKRSGWISNSQASFFLMPSRNCCFPTARPWLFPTRKVTFSGSIFRLFSLDSSYVMTPIMLQGSHKWSGVRWGPRQGSWLQFLPKRCSMIITYVLVFQYWNKNTYILVLRLTCGIPMNSHHVAQLYNFLPSIGWMIWNYFSLFQEVSSVSSGFNMFGWINSTSMMLIDLKNPESTDLGGSLISLFATVVLYGFVPPQVVLDFFQQQ